MAVHARPHAWSRRLRARFASTLAVGLLAVITVITGTARASTPPSAPGEQAPSQVTAPGPSSLATEAEREFTTMTATRYQHHNQENATAGTYFYDCVGFVTYALGRAVPTAQSTILTTFSIRPGFVPSPGLYVRLFNQLDGTQAGWSAVQHVADLAPGDIVAWSYDRASSSNEPGHDHSSRGHAFVVAAAPQPDGPNRFLVQVWDSTATPHGPNDTRRTNPKNLPGPNGKPSGLGTGTVQLDARPDGTLVTVHWTPTSGPVPAAHFAMGHPTS
jgi:hypothetical protein